ncbi:hypothetical protein CRI94_10385 [Longibacter salinarum]|uniref:Uncharacterized protein n=1 Tax=Longibacter salinarum TaxID=1850348 RepID=A0A2A8CWT5_9BACT|nr:hypothetical protein CRI94_10385 [Longibacter salinarum]
MEKRGPANGGPVTVYALLRRSQQDSFRWSLFMESKGNLWQNDSKAWLILPASENVHGSTTRAWWLAARQNPIRDHPKAHFVWTRG